MDIRSQDAFELAIKGITRPANKSIPMLYGIKCVNFDPPDFIIGLLEWVNFFIIVLIYILCFFFDTFRSSMYK